MENYKYYSNYASFPLPWGVSTDALCNQPNLTLTWGRIWSQFGSALLCPSASCLSGRRAAGLGHAALAPLLSLKIKITPSFYISAYSREGLNMLRHTARQLQLEIRSLLNVFLVENVNEYYI